MFIASVAPLVNMVCSGLIPRIEETFILAFSSSSCASLPPLWTDEGLRGKAFAHST